MAWSIEGAAAKLKRVDANLQEFSKMLDAYIATEPYTIVPEFEPDTTWHRIYIEPEVPPAMFALIVGEAVHNLRSGLDHIAWQLANLDGPPSQPHKVQFPIFGTAPADFFNHPSVNGMRDQHKIVLEDLQPYHFGHGDTKLEWLALLSNTDKHRLLHTTASNAQELVPRFLSARKGYVIERSEFGYRGLLEGRTEVGRLLVTPTNPDLQVDMQLAPWIGISFGEKGVPFYGYAADGLLRILKETAEGLVRVFDRPGINGAPPWP
jgi:hypothetical protein